MKRIWVFLPLLLLVMLFDIILFILPSQYTNTYLEGLKGKITMLHRRGDKPRIVLIGGSGAAFSLKSDMLEQEIPDFSVVNFGLYGGLGTAPMMDLALPEIRAGDIVILSPEQNAQTLSGFFGPRAMWQAADGMPGLLFRLNQEKQKAMVGESLNFAAEKFAFWLSGSAPKGDGVYALDHFNAWGDLISDGREGNAMPGGYDPDMLIHFSHELPSCSFLREMNEFSDACRRKGAMVYYHFCPMNAAAIPEEERKSASDYEEYLVSQLNFPLLGDVEGSIFDSAWFFDTNFHLNAAGAVLFTARLAKELKAELNLVRTLSIVLPSPPPSMNTGSSLSDNRDTACFVAEERNGEAFLTELTEKGKTMNRLSVPGEIQGLMVTAFSPALFAGNRTVEEIILPSSIRHVGNGSFSGCVSLKNVILQQPSPARCTVGDGLLEGTDAEVIVPAAAYSLYQTNYFRSLYAARIRPDAETAPRPVQLPETISIEAGTMYVDANGGVPVHGTETRISFPISATHLRTNTPLGQNLFQRQGFVPLCWNTVPDGSGEDIPFGSRTDSENGKTLYMRWIPQTLEKELIWEEKDGEAWVTGWVGSGNILALPEKLGGMPVTHLVKGAFEQAEIETAILPPTLFSIEQNTFVGSAVREIWLYDSLYYVYETSFSDCRNLRTLHIGAATAPRYSISYFGAFADKLDWLRLHRETPKIVLAGGSATRYAYDSERLAAAFPEFIPVNMGVYAYTNMLPQYRIMEHFMMPGDILISAPEFDTVKTQFCVSNAMDERFWNMAEADWACVSMLDLQEYSEVFSSLSDFLHARRMMTVHRYEESPSWFDDDGNAASKPTYNCYGDYTLARPNGNADVLLQSYRADYTEASFLPETINSLDRIYQEFKDLGVKVFFAYAPRNHSALTEESISEARLALDRYLRERLHVPFLLSIEDSLYYGWQCYLIDNHLSDEGVKIHMYKIQSALAEQLGL
ncbi:MAG: leucine-rich repeat protein [Clostridia bacterium]|nr:leucine-rich repeat protein [Clostridia bacterium]